jgi:acyl-coenzyme A thioesterase PaaI-like protein
MANKERSLGRVDFVNASVKRRFVVNIHTGAFVVCADYALAYAVVNFPSGGDKNVTVDASKVRVGLCVSNGNFELGGHD